MSKINVSGPGASALFKQIEEDIGEIREDWTKILITRKGISLRYINPDTLPIDFLPLIDEATLFLHDEKELFDPEFTFEEKAQLWYPGDDSIFRFSATDINGDTHYLDKYFDKTLILINLGLFAE